MILWNAQTGHSVLIDLWARLVHLKRVYAENILEIVTHVVSRNDVVEHSGSAIGQNRKRQGGEFFEGWLYFGKCRQGEIHLHELLSVVFVAGEFQRAATEGQSVLSDFPEIFVATHQGAQPGIFELFGAPELAERCAVSRE